MQRIETTQLKRNGKRDRERTKKRCGERMQLTTKWRRVKGGNERRKRKDKQMEDRDKKQARRSRLAVCGRQKGNEGGMMMMMMMMMITMVCTKRKGQAYIHVAIRSRSAAI